MCNFTYTISEEALILNGIRLQACSGPYGKGALPPGFYNVGRFQFIKEQKGFCVDDICFWIKLTPMFETKRTGLGIHPDGNVSGTLGCIGLKAYSVTVFRDIWIRLNELPEILKVIE